MKRSSTKQSNLAHFFSKKSALQNETSACSGVVPVVVDVDMEATDTVEPRVSHSSVPIICSSANSSQSDPDILINMPISADAIITDEQPQQVCEIENTTEQELQGQCKPVLSAAHPQCWDQDQYLAKCVEYPWLVANDGKLGCNVCSSAKNLGSQASQGVRLAPEWVMCDVSTFGETIYKQQQSLRKKIFDHKNSTAHKAALNAVNSAAKQAVEKSFAKQSKVENDTTCRVFRTVYKIVKKERPFSDLPDDIVLQQLNGLNMGRILQSDHACADIADHIATEMRSKITKNIVEKRQKLSVLIDESTTVSGITALTVCIRAVVGDSEEPLTFFLDMIELKGTDAITIKNAVISCLHKHGFDQQYLNSHFICFAADGASSMMGYKSGVATLLKADFPNIVTWHCANHRLELAVGDMAKEVSGMNNIQSFFDKLYSTYHASSKNQRELRDCSQELNTQILKIGRILDVRWVASSERSVKAVWTGYSTLHRHFSEATGDTSRDSSIRAKYKGLNARLTSKIFLHNLGIMYDALTELSDLSRQLQRRDMTFERAHRLIDRQIRVIESMADNPGPMLMEADEAVRNNSFMGVTLGTNTKVDVELRQGQFFRSLSENLRKRMFTTTNSHTGHTSSKQEQDNALLYNQLVKSTAVLNVESWPSPTGPTYGEAEVRILCARFKVDERGTVLAFREFKDDAAENKMMPRELKPLKSAVDTLVVSTAECERTFSAMNDILTPIRNSLSIARLSSIIFLKCVGPPLILFKPEGFVKSWIVSGRRTADETCCMARDKQVPPSAYDSMWKLCN